MYTYRFTMEAITSLIDDAEPLRLQFTVANHDDLFKIVKAIQAKDLLEPNESAALAIGLKLLSEVVLRRRSETLFTSIVEPLKELIRDLKAIPVRTPPSILREGLE